MRHRTFDTCSDKSKVRLEKLWSAIRNYCGVERSSEYFVMVAPNCVKEKFKPPAGHKSLYYFSPPACVIDYILPKKRKERKTVSNQNKRSKKD